MNIKNDDFKTIIATKIMNVKFIISRRNDFKNTISQNNTEILFLKSFLQNVYFIIVNHGFCRNWMYNFRKIIDFFKST